MDRLPGRLGNGPRLLGRVRPLAELALIWSCRSAPSSCVGLFDWRRWRRREPRPAGPARLRRLALLLQPRRNRRLGAARLSGAGLPAGDGACGSGSADAASGLRPVWPTILAADRGALPDGLPGRAQHGRRGGDRRRLRGRRRRPPDRPRRTALRRLPRKHPLRRHLRPGQLRGLRAVRGDLAVRRANGTTCPPHTAPRSPSTSPPSSCCSSLGIRIRPGTGRPPLGATLAFGWAAFPYTAYVLESELQRRAGRALLLVATLLVLLARRRAASPLSLATWTKFMPAHARTDAADLRPGPRAPARFDARRLAAVPFCSPASSVVDFLAVTVLVMLWPTITPASRSLRPHDRRPGRPQLAVQHLGPGQSPGTSSRSRSSWDRACSRSLLAFVPRSESRCSRWPPSERRS